MRADPRDCATREDRYVDARVIEQIIVREQLRTGSHINQANYLGSGPCTCWRTGDRGKRRAEPRRLLRSYPRDRQPDSTR